MGEGDEASTLQRVVDRCVAEVPGCDHASVSLHRRRGSKRVFAGSSPVAEHCLRLQEELGEGPSVEAWSGGDAQLVATLEVDVAQHALVATAAEADGDAAEVLPAAGGRLALRQRLHRLALVELTAVDEHELAQARRDRFECLQGHRLGSLKPVLRARS